MTAWWKSRVGKVILGTLLLIIIGGFGFRAWLNSGIGRGVIETRLSAAMGRPVQLGEDLRIEFLPLPGATGSDLQIFSRDGRRPLLAAGRYVAQLELWPLLSGEVKVVALRASEATLDIGILQSEEAPSGSGEAGLSGLPSIQRFELSNTNVFFDGAGSEPYLRIASLSLDGFRTDQPAEFDSRLGLIMDDGPSVDLDVSGLLTLKTEGDVDVELLKIDIDYDNWLIVGLKGQLKTSGDESILDAVMDWSDGEQAFRMSARTGWSPDFTGGQEGLVFEAIELQLDGHAIKGNGCLLQGEDSQLNLNLYAPTMNLEGFYRITEKWKTAVATPGDARDSKDELPFGVGARLVIDQASYEGTLAEGVVLTVGAGPNCPDRL